MNRFSDYLAYGVSLDADLNLGEFLHSSEHSKVGLLVRRVNGEAVQADLEHCDRMFTSHGRELFIHSDSPFGSSRPGQPWCIEVKGVVSFYWISGQPLIEYVVGEAYEENLVAFWLIHIFLPIYLTMEHGYDFLHAGAVDVAGRTILFIAPSMGGKSTLTEFFLRHGHTLVSDDKVATFIDGDRFMAVPSHANYRPYRKFEDMGLSATEFSEIPRPIHAFYVLERVAADQDIVISELEGFRKFDQLLPNYLFSFSHLKAQRLRYLADMVDSVPLFEIKVPGDLGRLGEVHDAIVEHASNLKARSAKAKLAGR